MHVMALVSGLGWHIQDLARAAGSASISFQPLLFSRIDTSLGATRRLIHAEGVDLTRAEAILIRMMPPGSLEQVVFRMDALQRLAAAGVPVVNNPRAIEIGVDKYLALALLAEAGLSVPDTWCGESADAALIAFERLGGDVVIKPLFGSEGRGMMRVAHIELARRSLHALERLSAVLYLQRAIRHPGHDLRVFVIGERVVGAIRRHAPEGEWRTNVAVGGRAEACRLDVCVERIALRAARAVGAEVAGVDLIEDLDAGGAYVVLEVNAVPGWRALSEAARVDVAAEILQYLRVKARR